MISNNKCTIEAVIVPRACGLAYTLWSETVRHVSRSGGLSSLRASAGNFRETFSLLAKTFRTTSLSDAGQFWLGAEINSDGENTDLLDSCGHSRKLSVPLGVFNQPLFPK
jgi:hypothetical protein